MYTQRLVAFIDILGFSDFVENHTFDETNSLINEFESIFNFTDRNITSMIQSHLNSGRQFDTNKINFKYFSDSIIWSYPYTEVQVDYEFVVIHTISSLNLAQLLLYDKGILIRGRVIKR